jgi:hypothetical protein
LEAMVTPNKRSAACAPARVSSGCWIGQRGRPDRIAGANQRLMWSFTPQILTFMPTTTRSSCSQNTRNSPPAGSPRMLFTSGAAAGPV